MIITGDNAAVDTKDEPFTIKKVRESSLRVIFISNGMTIDLYYHSVMTRNEEFDFILNEFNREECRIPNA